ncbi:MAG: hypothetical protein KBA53_10430 [Thermoclostridium sp.]|nr:hypothetical protein [Thermoclostridium sp.]
MKTSKTNIYTTIGIFLFSMTLLLKNLISLPEFFCGLGLGTGLGLEVLGLLQCSPVLTRLKNAKRAFFKRPVGEPHQ